MKNATSKNLLVAVLLAMLCGCEGTTSEEDDPGGVLAKPGLPTEKTLSALTSDEQILFATTISERLSPLVLTPGFQSQYCGMTALQSGTACEPAMGRCSRKIDRMNTEVTHIQISRTAFQCDVNVGEALTCIEEDARVAEAMAQTSPLTCTNSDSDLQAFGTELIALRANRDRCKALKDTCTALSKLLTPDVQLAITDAAPVDASGIAPEASGAPGAAGGDSFEPSPGSPSSDAPFDPSSPSPQQQGAPAEANGCQFAYNGVCDEPMYCPVGTDTDDCTRQAPGNHGRGAANEGPNRCQFARNGICEEPTYCPVGTDTDDCTRQGPGNQERGSANDGSDSCQFAHDGICDEPPYCAAGTDQTDCSRDNNAQGRRQSESSPNYGAPCENHDQCSGGSDYAVCMHEYGPYGYCAGVGCQPGTCGPGGVCLTALSGERICVAACRQDSDCRRGQFCGADRRDPNLTFCATL